MSSLVKGIDQTLKEINGNHYFVAISGGKDSVALAHIVHQLGYSMTLLHVNYHLRGEESNEDQHWIENFAAKYHLPLKIYDVQENIKEFSKGNLQDLARKIRYSFFEKERLKIKNSFILIGHHQQDQIENFWIHLFRNSGRSGLKGMVLRQNNIIRPMLNYKADEIYNYLVVHKIKWREDSSNKKNDYLRNYLRNNVIPLLKNEFNSLDSSITLIQEVFKKEEEKDLAELNEFNKRFPSKIPVNELLAFSSDKLLLFLKQYGVKGSQLVSFNKFLKAGSGAKFQISTVSSFKKNREFIECSENLNFSLNHSINVQQIDCLPSEFNKYVLYLNKLKVNGNLMIRYWKQGDRIFPIGLNGSKLLSDVFSDAKISIDDKKKIPIVCDNDHILWCYGLCVDKRKIAKKNDTELLKITLNL